MTRLIFAAVALALLLRATASPGEAATPYVVQIDMYGPQVVPSVSSTGWGFVRFFFSQDRLAADYTVDVKGFSNNLVLGADIRRGASGTNGPILHHLTDGDFITMGSHIAFSANELDDMSTGQWYVTVYTSLHPNGEMRGQVILPADFRPPAPPIVPVARTQPAQAASFPVLGIPPVPVPPLPEPVASAPSTVPEAASPPVEASPSPSISISPPNTGDAGIRAACRAEAETGASPGNEIVP